MLLLCFIERCYIFAVYTISFLSDVINAVLISISRFEVWKVKILKLVYH